MNEAEIDFEISNHMISCIIDMRVSSSLYEQQRMMGSFNRIAHTLGKMCDNQKTGKEQTKCLLFVCLLDLKDWM